MPFKRSSGEGEVAHQRMQESAGTGFKDNGWAGASFTPGPQDTQSP